MTYYRLEGFVSDHIDLLQRHSALLRDLIAFETNQGNVWYSVQHSVIPHHHSHHIAFSKLLKKRINLLEPILGEINPQVYGNFYAAIAYEVATAYSDMVDTKVCHRHNVVSNTAFVILSITSVSSCRAIY